MNRTITKNAIDSVNRFTFLRLNRMLNHFSAFLRLRTGDLDVFERIVKSGQELKLGLLSKTSFSWLFERKKNSKRRFHLVPGWLESPMRFGLMCDLSVAFSIFTPSSAPKMLEIPSVHVNHSERDFWHECSNLVAFMSMLNVVRLLSIFVSS